MLHNQGKRDFRAAGIPVSDPVAAAVRAGYEDFRNGRGFAEIYDKAMPAQQVSYEAGRRVAACLSAFSPLPAWPDNVAFESLTFNVNDDGVLAFQVEDALTKRLIYHRPQEQGA